MSTPLGPFLTAETTLEATYAFLNANSVSLTCTSSSPTPCPANNVFLFARNASSQVYTNAGGSACTPTCLDGVTCSGPQGEHCSVAPPNLFAPLAVASYVGLCGTNPPTSPQETADLLARPKANLGGSTSLWKWDISPEAYILYCWGATPIWMLEVTPASGVQYVFDPTSFSSQVTSSFKVPSSCSCS